MGAVFSEASGTSGSNKNPGTTIPGCATPFASIADPVPFLVVPPSWADAASGNNAKRHTNTPVRPPRTNLRRICMFYHLPLLLPLLKDERARRNDRGAMPQPLGLTE